MTDYEKLTEIIDDIDFLVEHRVTSTVPAFIAWKSNAERFLIYQYGQESFEYKDFLGIKFASLGNSNILAQQNQCENGLRASKLIFKGYLKEIANKSETSKTINARFDKVFIVHGHDGELKHAVARLVEKQGIVAIILSEQANKGKTIIEKFEENCDVSGAICLFTADDFGRAKADTNEQTRARQNVVLETGYFMGKLGRERVVVIAEKGVELPSDMQGIVYTDKNNWERDVLKELMAMGYTINANKLFDL